MKKSTQPNQLKRGTRSRVMERKQLLKRMCLFHCGRPRVEFRFIARFTFVSPNKMCVYFVIYAVTPLQIILMGQYQKKKYFV